MTAVGVGPRKGAGDDTVATLSARGLVKRYGHGTATAFGTKAVIMDEPTAALGVAESGKVLALIDRIRGRGLPVALISHNMPHMFEIADRIHVHRLGERVAVVSPKTHTMNQVVGLITGALRVGEDGVVEEVGAAVHTGLSP